MSKTAEYLFNSPLHTTWAESMFEIIEDMIRSRPNYIFMSCWKYLTLVSLIGIYIWDSQIIILSQNVNRHLTIFLN